MSGTAPSDDGALRAVDRDHVALPDDGVADSEELVGCADPQGLGADHRRLAPAAGDDGSVADQAAPGGQDAFGGEHAVHVLGRGLVAHEDHVLATGSGRSGVIGREAHGADRGAGRSGEPLGQDG